MCGAMNALHTFLTGLAAGMDIIADCHRLTQRALIEAGCPDTTATRLLASLAAGDDRAPAAAG